MAQSRHVLMATLVSASAALLVLWLLKCVRCPPPAPSTGAVEALFLSEPHLQLLDLCPHHTELALKALRLRRQVLAVGASRAALQRLEAAARGSEGRLTLLWRRVDTPSAVNAVGDPDEDPLAPLLQLWRLQPLGRVAVRLCLDQMDAVMLADPFWHRPAIRMVLIDDPGHVSGWAAAEIAQERRRRIFFDTAHAWRRLGFQMHGSTGSSLAPTGPRWPARVVWLRETTPDGPRNPRASQSQVA